MFYTENKLAACLESEARGKPIAFCAHFDAVDVSYNFNDPKRSIFYAKKRFEFWSSRKGAKIQHLTNTVRFRYTAYAEVVYLNLKDDVRRNTRCGSSYDFLCTQFVRVGSSMLFLALNADPFFAVLHPARFGILPLWASLLLTQQAGTFKSQEPLEKSLNLIY